MDWKMGQAHSWRFVIFGISFHLIPGILVCLLLSTAPAASSDVESKILLEFSSNSAVNSNPIAQRRFSTWNDSDQTPCAWIGVTCTANYSVEGLNFSGWGLDPRMPALSLLSALKDLRRLDLSSNGVPFLATFPDAEMMTMPKDIGSLTGLIFLDLSRNDYEGEIQSNISGCQNLQYLYLADNLLERGISCLTRTQASSWNSLKVLDLSNNNLGCSTSETIPDPVSFLLENLPESLTELRVGGNNFQTSYQSIELQSGNWPRNLQVLDLSNNSLQVEISGTLFSSAGLPSLKNLNLSNNYATGQIPTDVNSLVNLTVFDVSNNYLFGSLSFIQPGSPLYNASFFARNTLCDGPLAPCKDTSAGKLVLPLWMVRLIVGISAILVMGSCLVAAWRWRVYNRRHQQDAEFIKALLEGESPTLMSLRELKTATNNFAESAQIGEGGFGKVYRGQLKDGTVVAIKKSKREGCEKDKQQFLNEVRILTQLNHRHLVKLLGCCMENKVAVLVFEFVSNGTLKEHLQRKCGAPTLRWKQRLNIAVQTADALNYLHSAATVPIYHRDVKSANILLNGDLNAKVADFGISKLVPVEVTHVSTMAVQGTIGYIDPEYYTSLKLTDKSDVYGFGVVLLELISGKPAIDFQRCTEESSLVIFAKPHIESGDLEQLIDPILLETYLDTNGEGRESISRVGKLAVQCLNMRSKSRPSMQEVWHELQNLWLLLLQIEGTSQQLESINEDSRKDPQNNFRDFLPSNSLLDFSSSTIQCKTRGIEMSQFSR